MAFPDGGHIQTFSVCLFILREKESECMSKGGTEKEREGGRQRIPSRRLAVSAEPDAGLDPMNREIMTWAKIKSRMLNPLSYLGAPRTFKI